MQPDGSIALDQPVELPDVLDLLIVGGGPIGTAAAFRAKEIGLAALVIDYDDIMARIRDYAKDKLIYPSYGGGDNMKFPKGGSLVDKLHFPPLDKDDMFEQWKLLYTSESIPARVGMELVGMAGFHDGVWVAECWNHNLKEQQNIAARHVILGFGRGVPRRLDIPGAVEGLAFRLSDASLYVGEPVCVIGGGTSAAEVVIEISNAKAAAGDPSKVCWSYRGEQMPKVSKALAEVFFDAYVGNGNIRYLPNSNPTAVTGEGDDTQLVIATDEVGPDGKPIESRPLEFGKNMCIACIGSDVPEKLLASFGINMVTGGKANKKRMVVSPLLESVLPQVYIGGDLLSPVYLETDDFSADPSKFREIKRRGNIKAALRDGVLIADVVAQKLAGKTDIDVVLEFAEDDDVAAPDVDVVEPVAAADEDVAAPAPIPEETVVMLTDGGEPAAARPEIAVPGPGAMAALSLVRLLPGGDEGDVYPVAGEGRTTLGRRGCDVEFAQDTTLDDVHAAISRSGEGWVLHDESAGSGVFLQLADSKRLLPAGTILRAGQQWLVCGTADDPGLLQHFDAAGTQVGSYRIGPKTSVVGRQAPDINLDAHDLSLSRRHLSFVLEDEGLVARDLKSTGGTFARVDGTATINPGDRLLIGQQKLEVSETVAGVEQEEIRLDAAQSSVLDASRLTLGDFPMRTPQATDPAARAIDEALSGSVPMAPTEAADEDQRAAAAAADAADAAPSAAAAGAEAPPAAAAPAGAVVVFRELGLTVPVRPGQTLCEVAEENGIEIIADCHAGVCGSDPVCVHAGQENFNEIGDEERDALEDICELEPGPYRLACMARISGSVEVSLVEE